MYSIHRGRIENLESALQANRPAASEAAGQRPLVTSHVAAL